MSSEWIMYSLFLLFYLSIFIKKLHEFPISFHFYCSFYETKLGKTMSMTLCVRPKLFNLQACGSTSKWRMVLNFYGIPTVGIPHRWNLVKGFQTTLAPCWETLFLICQFFYQTFLLSFKKIFYIFPSLYIWYYLFNKWWKWSYF